MPKWYNVTRTSPRWSPRETCGQASASLAHGTGNHRDVVTWMCMAGSSYPPVIQHSHHGKSTHVEMMYTVTFFLCWVNIGHWHKTMIYISKWENHYILAVFSYQKYWLSIFNCPGASVCCPGNGRDCLHCHLCPCHPAQFLYPKVGAGPSPMVSHGPWCPLRWGWWLGFGNRKEDDFPILFSSLLQFCPMSMNHLLFFWDRVFLGGHGPMVMISCTQEKHRRTMNAPSDFSGPTGSNPQPWGMVHRGKKLQYIFIHIQQKEIVNIIYIMIVMPNNFYITCYAHLLWLLCPIAMPIILWLSCLYSGWTDHIASTVNGSAGDEIKVRKKTRPLGVVGPLAPRSCDSVRTLLRKKMVIFHGKKPGGMGFTMVKYRYFIVI